MTKKSISKLINMKEKINKHSQIDCGYPSKTATWCGNCVKKYKGISEENNPYNYFCGSDIRTWDKKFKSRQEEIDYWKTLDRLNKVIK